MERRFNSLNDYYRSIFGKKVVSISLDAGLNCPNRDGSKGYGGCIFCTKTPYVGDSNMSIGGQADTIKKLLSNKWKETSYIAFLEYGSNTYASLDKLKEIYEEALGIDGVVGLDIATRCDVISDNVLDYLDELNKKTFLTIELGLESSHDKTLKLINRCHTKDDFTDCVRRLKSKNIRVVAHIINGLPYESEEDMIESSKYLNDLGVDGVKFHMLYIDKDAKIYEMYKSKKFNLLSEEEYIKIVARQLEYLNKDIVIHRIMSGPNRKSLVEPKWLNHKFKVLNDFNKYLEDNDIRQGDKAK